MEPIDADNQQENSEKRVVGVPFVKGQSGNPLGRPKDSFSITRLIREALEAQDEKQAKQLAQALILNAAKGNGTAIKEIMSRIDGVIPTKTDHTNNGEAFSPIQIYIPDNGRDTTD